mgnify:FL=1
MEKLVKKKVEIYVYMIMVTVTCVFLSYSEWMYKYIYTLKAVKLLKGCLNSFFILSIIVCSLRVCWERCDQRIIEKIFNFIWKAILIIILWKIMLLYFCIYCIYNGLENKNLVKPYKNLIIYTVVNGVELTVFWIIIFFVCRRESIKKAKESQKRVRGYLISNLWKEIMLVGLVLVFSKEQNLEMIASEIDVRNDFLLIPFLIGYWVYILKKIIAICIWNYDWEKTYANELKENGIAPNIETVPFPN